MHTRSYGLAALALLAAMVAVVFGQTRAFDFLLYDDPGIVYRHAQVCAGLTGSGIVWAFTHAHPYMWMPLTTLTHMLDVSLFGLWAGGHHLTSVLLHAVNSMLLYVVLRRFTGRAGLSFVVAALFAVHPLRAESVVWISSRKDLTSGLFFMLTLLAYHWYAARPNWKRYGAVAACFALGLMCKPTLIPLPGLLLLLDWWPLERLQWGNALRRVVEKTPLILVAVLRTALEFRTQDASLDAASFAQVPLSARIAETASNLVVYVGHWLYPVPLAIHYPRPLEAPLLWPGAIALVVLLAVTFVLLMVRRHRALAVGWFWYLGMMLPMAGVIQYGHAVMADRYTYLPHIGLAILAVWLVDALLAPELSAVRRWTARIAAAACLLVVTLLGWWQVGYWRDTETVFRRALAVTSGNDVALLKLGRNEQGHAALRRALELRGDNATAREELARRLMGWNLADAAGTYAAHPAGNP